MSAALTYIQTGDSPERVSPTNQQQRDYRNSMICELREAGVPGTVLAGLFRLGQDAVYAICAGIVPRPSPSMPVRFTRPEPQPGYCLVIETFENPDHDHPEKVGRDITAAYDGTEDPPDKRLTGRRLGQWIK